MKKNKVLSFFAYFRHSTEKKQDLEVVPMLDPVPTSIGVSLRYLCSLPISPSDSFSEAVSYVKKQTESNIGDRSLACHLQRVSPHLVKDVADIFVSYAWGGGFGTTMGALVEMFCTENKDVFVWMDFAVVDQWKASESILDFDALAEVFSGNLRKIGRAVLVLTPGVEPIAMTRAWCVFEWTTIAQMKIPFDFCVNSTEESSLREAMSRGKFNFPQFVTLFSKVDVERAQAFQPDDLTQILVLLRRIGVVTVNDIVMGSVKAWIAGVLDRVETISGSEEEVYVLLCRADLSRALGKLETALQEYQIALDAARLLEGRERLVAVCLINIATLLAEGSIPEGAENKFREALHAWTMLLGADHVEVARIQLNLASVLMRLRQFEESESLMRKSLQVLRHHAVGNDPAMVLALGQLGLLTVQTGRAEEAESLVREGLFMATALYGENHPRVSGLYSQLAQILSTRAGDLEEAEVLFRRVVAVDSKVMGQYHPRLGYSWMNLGLFLLYHRHNAETALTALQQAEEIFVLGFGRKSEPTARAIGGKGEAFFALERWEEAEKAAREACHIKREVMGETNPEVIRSQVSLSEHLGKLPGRKQDARAILEHVVFTLVKVEGESHPAVVHAKELLAAMSD